MPNETSKTNVARERERECESAHARALTAYLSLSLSVSLCLSLLNHMTYTQFYSVYLSLPHAVVVPPWPKSVTWYNKDGRVETADRYKLIEDGLGVYMIEIKPSESCDEGDWKCVVTSFEGCVGITACVVNMDSALRNQVWK